LLKFAKEVEDARFPDWDYWLDRFRNREGPHRGRACGRWTGEDIDKLATAGVEPLVGSLGDQRLLHRAASDVDGVIHTAFGSGFDDYKKLSREDVDAIQAFGDAFAGSDRPLIVTHGLGTLPAGTSFTEDARPGIIPEYPRASEQTAFALATQGIKASVVRPARSVHGLGERHGFVPQFAALARKKRVSAYVGDGDSLWPACHRCDVARVFRLALERGVGGEAYHAVAEGVPFKMMAEAIGQQVGVPTRSLLPEEAAEHFGKLAIWVTGSGTVSTNLTRKRLLWEPREIDFIADIDRPEYFTNGEAHEN
jgi:nucleoside-diphosphate-sugar epimerase